MTKPDHWSFYLVDAGAYLLIFALLVPALRFCLRRIAPHEADESFAKSFVVTLLIVLTTGTIVTLPCANDLGLLIVLPCIFGGIVLVRALCWVTVVKAILIVLVFSVVSAGIAIGVTTMANKSMPKGRVTLLGRTRLSLNLLSGIAGQPGESVVPKDLLHKVKSGLLLEAGSYVSAIGLLNDPEAFKQLTTNNIEDLAALGVAMDGKPLTPEQLDDLGIVYEDARKGADVLQTMTATNVVTEDDVKAVAALLHSVRKPGSTVTAAEAVFIIGEARKRAGQIATNVLCVATSNSLALAAAQLSATSSTVSAAASAGTSQALVAVDCAAADKPRENLSAKSTYRDSWLVLSLEERATWDASRTGLVVGALMSSHSGKTIAIVNKTLVHTGDVVSVNSAGRTYAWRLVSITVTGATWRPVLAGKNVEGAEWVTWR